MIMLNVKHVCVSETECTSGQTDLGLGNANYLIFYITNLQQTVWDTPPSYDPSLFALYTTISLF